MTRLRSSLAVAWPALLAIFPELCAVGFAVGWFFYLGYGPTLPPSAIAWMFRDDWAAYLWGFAFYRDAAWEFPLGSVPNLFYPRGTSIGFTDANPWLSLLLKPFSSWLPLDFQFSGLWFLLCYCLQAWFGAQISKTLTRDPLVRALGGALFATTPILPIRAQHVALCAVFFVTAGVWLNLLRVESTREARRVALVSLALLTWAAGTHGYLSVMLLVLCFAFYARLWLVDKQLPLREAAALAAAALGCTLIVYYLFGYIGWKKTDLAVEGFGDFSGDLLALVNPQGWSRLLPDLPHRPRQWEGFLYLGLGTLGLLVLRMGRSFMSPSATLRALAARWPLLVVTAAMLFYSWSSVITLRGEMVLDLRALYAPLGELPGIFRSSGRFGWPLHVLLTAAGVSAVAGLQNHLLSRALLLLALALQIAEQDPNRLHFEPIPLHALRHEAWQSAGRDYAHLAVVPVHIQWECPYDGALVNALSYEAYRRKLTFNSGNFMRKEPGVRSDCGRGLTGPLDERTVYVVERQKLSDFRARRAVCGMLDGLNVCVTDKRATPLREALAASPIP